MHGRLLSALLSRMRRTLGQPVWLALALLAWLSPAPLLAETETAWDVLKRPGAIAIMRHALAPGTGDPANFMLGVCTTQRNLDDRGRDQARAIGEALRANRVFFQRVLTSQWCRCRETAELLRLARVEDFPPLNSFFQDRAKAVPQTKATRRFLASLPDDVRVLLVTHQVNITALTGRTVSSGEIVIINVAPDGTVDVLGDILIEPEKEPRVRLPYY